MAETLAFEQDNLEQDQKRQLEADKKKKPSPNKATDEAADKLRQEAVLAARRIVLRFINSAFAATLVGLVVTFIIMSVQAVAGNYFASKIVPPLSGVELMIWAVLFLFLIVGVTAIVSLAGWVL